MSKVFQILKHEFYQVLPPTIFFFVAFNIIAVTRALMLEKYGIHVSSFATATVGALVVGKVVLVVDKLPLINKFPDKPLIYNVVWKTAIYVLAVFVVRAVEHLLPFLGQYGDLGAATRHLLNEVVWPQFWAIQIWLAVLFSIYSALHELVRVVGKDEVRRMFLGPLRISAT